MPRSRKRFEIEKRFSVSICQDNLRVYESTIGFSLRIPNKKKFIHISKVSGQTSAKIIVTKALQIRPVKAGTLVTGFSFER